MKRLQKLCAVMVLMSALAVSVCAGDISAGVVPPPPPPQPTAQPTEAATDETSSEVLQLVEAILQGVLSVF